MSGGSPGAASSGITTGSSERTSFSVSRYSRSCSAASVRSTCSVAASAAAARHPRVADEAVADLGHPPPVVHARQLAAAFEDPGGAVAMAAALLDHQQLGAHERSLRIRGPSGVKPFSR